MRLSLTIFCLVLLSSICFASNKLPVLEYHMIGSTESRWTRTADHFRKDIEWLYQHGYYPMNMRDFLNGFQALPKGKKPVVLTFDDSSSSQFRYLPNGDIDPNCAIGILKAFHELHPKDWPMRATFFVLIETNAPDRNLFGQNGLEAKKIKQLADWGMEIGSHNYSHDRFDWLSKNASCRTICRSVKKLTELAGMEIVSLAVPMGIYPKDLSVFSGDYQGFKYKIRLVAEVGGGMQPYPNSNNFDPLHIKRIQALDSQWKQYFGR